MSDTVVYSILDTPEEFETATDVEIAVWGLDARDAIPPNLFRAVTHNSGVAIGASIADEMIGIAFGFLTERSGRRILWSHLTGVLQSHQGRGIGEGLKQAQREWALENRFDEIRWTFDPLQRGNANFNLARLGAFSDSYHINMYGVMNDAINAGIPSDRVEAVWNLHRPATPSPSVTSETPLALCIDPDGHPEINDVFNAETLLAEIPANLAILRDKTPDLALKWRLALRQTLSDAFRQGFIAVNFVEVPQRQTQAYLLTKLRG